MQPAKQPQITISEELRNQERTRKRDDRVRIAKIGNDWIVALPKLDGAFRHYELCSDFETAKHIAFLVTP